MSTRQLAGRLGVTPQSISELEASERTGTIQLQTLRRVANAMDCDVVYALVPRAGSLHDTVMNRATEVARRELARIDVTMRLENQSVTREELDADVVEFAAALVDSRRLWDVTDVATPR